METATGSPTGRSAVRSRRCAQERPFPREQHPIGRGEYRRRVRIEEALRVGRTERAQVHAAALWGAKGIEQEMTPIGQEVGEIGDRSAAGARRA